MAERTQSFFRNLSFQVGLTLEVVLLFVGETFHMTLEAIGFLAERQLRGRSLLRQMSIIGADSLLLCVLILFFSGMVLGLNISSGMVRFGAASYVGGLVIISLTRELAPTLVGVLVAARAGSAMAAEIGSMAVSEQIDALRAMAVSPIRYLVVPRLAASILMLPLLTIIAEVAGAAGAYLIALQSGVSANQFIHSATVFLTERDLFGGLFKTAVFGLIIAVVSCRQGLRTQGGAVGVGKATTSAVVISIVLTLIANYFLSTVLVEPVGQK
jgi:phospholipid/cholesterol/gamma-HCH transport system permease protein